MSQSNFNRNQSLLVASVLLFSISSAAFAQEKKLNCQFYVSCGDAAGCTQEKLFAHGYSEKQMGTSGNFEFSAEPDQFAEKTIYPDLLSPKESFTLGAMIQSFSVQDGGGFGFNLDLVHRDSAGKEIGHAASMNGLSSPPKAGKNVTIASYGKAERSSNGEVDTFIYTLSCKVR